MQENCYQQALDIVKPGTEDADNKAYHKFTYVLSHRPVKQIP